MAGPSERPVAIVAVTASISAVLIKGQLEALQEAGFETIVICTPGEEIERLVSEEEATLIPIRMERTPSPIRDLWSLLQIVITLIKTRPLVLNAGTPKAGLLCMLGAWVCRVPIRIYTLHGLRHESLDGWSRTIQKMLERMTNNLATITVCVSPSVRRVAISERLLEAGKAVVLGEGSCGIELDRFRPELIARADTHELRRRLGIEDGALVVGFVGRLIPRKGVSELLQSWNMIRKRYPSSYLLLVGAHESEQPLPPETVEAIRRDERVIAVGMVLDVEHYIAIMDVMALPAHWEGFGNVLVEAAAMGVPVITTDGTGTRDAVSDGENGQIVPVKDAKALTEALDKYLANEPLRDAHGQAGRKWSTQFDRKTRTRQFAQLCLGLVDAAHVNHKSSRRPAP